MSMESMYSLGDIVRFYGNERPHHTALLEGTSTLTWSGLYERAQQVASGLSAAGVGNQDRIALLDKNGIPHFELMYGASLLNAVQVDVNWRLAAPEVEYIVNNAEAKVLVVGQDFVPILDAIADKLTSTSLILVVGGHPKYEAWDEWVSRQQLGDPHVASAPHDVCMQLYSSGTTGQPKGVMLSNENFFELGPMASTIWKLTGDSINLAAMPLFHIGGGGWANAGMLFGCTTVIVRDLDPVALIALIGKHRITHGFVVPALLQMMTMIPDVDKADFSSLVTIAYGASPISEEVLTRSVATFKCDFWQVYGLTETTGAVMHLPPADHDVNGPNKHRLRSCGLPGPGVEVRIYDNDNHRDCEPNEVGEIWVKTKQNMLGYWKRPEDTAKTFEGEWFKTGDAGYVDADGYVYIHDRVKDMIVSGAENVYPAEVENALMSHPGVADVAVIGIPHEKWGETPLAIVVRKPGIEVTEADIIAHAQTRLAKFKCPTQVTWTDVLPRNPSGKILKKDLREPYWAGRERRVN